MKFRFTHDELAEHLDKKIALCGEQIALVDREMESMEKLRDESPIAAATKSGHANPNEMLRSRRQQYEQVQAKYELFRKHLIRSDQDLDESDLETLGLLKSRYE